MDFQIFDLGLIDYSTALKFQLEVFKLVRFGFLESGLIFCQHDPVITLGRQASQENIFVSEAELAANGIDLYRIRRGGNVTYHGPGQLVIYPVFNLAYYKRDIHWFLRQLEGVAIDLLEDFGIQGERIAGKTGVWVKEKKIASIGIAIRHWITYHGMSINIKGADLDNFNLIRPCGMDIKMTSLETILARNIEIEDISKMVMDKFSGDRYFFSSKKVSVPILSKPGALQLKSEVSHG